MVKRNSLSPSALLPLTPLVLQNEMDAMAATHPDQFKVYYVLNQVSKEAVIK